MHVTGSPPIRSRLEWRGLWAVSATAHPGKGSSLPSCSSGPLARRIHAVCVRGAHAVGGSALSTRNPARGANGEEPMTTTIILLTINSIAQLIAAVAQLIAALRR